MSVGYVWEELYTKHYMGPQHPESPARLFAIKEVIDSFAGDKARRDLSPLERIHPCPATKEEIAYVHDRGYIDSVECTKGNEVRLDPDTSTSPGSWDAACLSAGGAIAAVDYVIGSDPYRSFAFLRPPGHHAERDHAKGFCIFNNIAIAAEHAIKKHGVKRIAILDFDIHHGNGTQNHFYDRSDVFFASTHRGRFYPGSGDLSETGEGAGKGYTINVQLNAGGGDVEFKMAWDRILPRIRKFSPELVLVSAGFDAHELDLLGGMNVTAEGFRSLAQEILKLTDDCCNGRAVFMLEGGYSLEALQLCVRAILEEMTA